MRVSPLSLRLASSKAGRGGCGRIVQSARFSTSACRSLRRVCTTSPSSSRCSPCPIAIRRRLSWPSSTRRCWIASLIASASSFVLVTSATRVRSFAHRKYASTITSRACTCVRHPVDQAALVELRGDGDARLLGCRFPHPQRQRRVVGVAEPVHGGEFDDGGRAAGHARHRSGVADGHRLQVVTDHRDPRAGLRREHGERVRGVQVDHAGLIDDDPIPRREREPARPRRTMRPVRGSISPGRSRVQTSAPASSLPHRQPWSASSACRLDAVAADLPSRDRRGLLRRRDHDQPPTLLGESSCSRPAASWSSPPRRDRSPTPSRSVPAIAAAACDLAARPAPRRRAARSWRSSRSVSASTASPARVRLSNRVASSTFSAAVADAMYALTCAGRSALIRQQVDASARVPVR